ncbi:regulatory protein RecX [Cohnella cellulosilytica]|uniref:Regulatory protein RecX n=1 Tax=Cohnella cellulosilytica TaxID=986710 RepID=A0ABW2FGA9_9BACL
MNREKQEQEQMSIEGAVVTGIESHPKKPQMYRVTLKLDVTLESEDEFAGKKEGAESRNSEDRNSEDWNFEVDELIAGAKAAKRSEETVLTVHEDTLVGWRLLKDRKLTADEVETLRQDEAKEEAYRSAMLMLERRPRTTAELSRALKRKGYAADVIEACVERLRSRKMLDDSAYAKRFTEQRAAGQRKGRMLIRQELLQRGVDRQDVERAIGDLDGEVEREAALALARKRWPATKGNDRERKMKLMGILLRRGFPSALARMAAQQAADESGEALADESDEGFQDSYDLDI